MMPVGFTEGVKLGIWKSMRKNGFLNPLDLLGHDAWTYSPNGGEIHGDLNPMVSNPQKKTPLLTTTQVFFQIHLQHTKHLVPQGVQRRSSGVACLASREFPGSPGHQHVLVEMSVSASES